MKYLPSGHAVVATIAGLALAAISKLTYDLFNGYALIPNAFLSIGLTPPQFVLEALLLCSLLALAFCIGTLLLKKAPTSPGLSAVLAGLPWVVLSIFGLVSGLQGAHGQFLGLQPSLSSANAAPQLLVAISIPVGLWLAVRRFSMRGEA